MDDSTAMLKKPEFIAKWEFAAAIVHIVTQSARIPEAELPKATAWLLGIKSTSAAMRVRVSEVVDSLVAIETLVRTGDSLRLPRN